MIDGATKKDIFFKNNASSIKTNYSIHSLLSFIGPWIDFISLAILGDATDKYTVAIGLFSMLQPDTINDWFLPFAAGFIHCSTTTLIHIYAKILC